MWLNKQLNEFFNETHTIGEKILDVRSENILEIFKSPNFEQIAIFNEKYFLTPDIAKNEGELLAHIGACVLPLELQKINALIIDSFNLEIAYELTKHEANINFIQSDEKVLDSLISFLPHYMEEKKSINLLKGILDLPLECNKGIDLLIHSKQVSRHELDGLTKLLSQNSVFISPFNNPFLDREGFRANLASFGTFFNIVMPFFIPFESIDKFYIFASNSLHPLADLRLARADMLEDLDFYSPDIQQAAFSMSPRILKDFKGLIKN